MYKYTLYFRVYGLATDEVGNPVPAGLVVTMDLEKEISYGALNNSVTVASILQRLSPTGMISLKNAEMISPEEYAQEFGEAS